MPRRQGRMEKGETVDIVLLDMSRAFDRVSHFKLIKQLKKVGYKGRILKFNIIHLEAVRIFVDSLIHQNAVVAIRSTRFDRKMGMGNRIARWIFCAGGVIVTDWNRKNVTIIIPLRFH